jgi:hypothetical protein
VTGHVIVENDSGNSVKMNDCGSPFQVLLTNTGVHQQPVWPACYGPLSVPVGVSNYPVYVTARYSMCHLKGPPPLCKKDGLPPGQYEANLFQSTTIAPTPPPSTVLVSG